jgi:hypothetical protein
MSQKRRKAKAAGKIRRAKNRAAPATIFKYEGCSLQSIQNLKKQSVYFAPPHRFNDPYDCKFPR